MKITMREAIWDSKNFKFDDGEYIIVSGILHRKYDNCHDSIGAKWILEHEDCQVEVEDNYWDKEGRAIRELEDGMNYHYSDGRDDDCQSTWTFHKTDKARLSVGNIFKTGRSIKNNNERLKDKQKERMEKAK